MTRAADDIFHHPELVIKVKLVVDFRVCGVGHLIAELLHFFETFAVGFNLWHEIIEERGVNVFKNGDFDVTVFDFRLIPPETVLFDEGVVVAAPFWPCSCGKVGFIVSKFRG